MVSKCSYHMQTEQREDDEIRVRYRGPRKPRLIHRHAQSAVTAQGASKYTHYVFADININKPWLFQKYSKEVVSRKAIFEMKDMMFYAPIFLILCLNIIKQDVL